MRRRRATEAAAEETRYDAAERRVTESQLKSVEQLGSDLAPVRLGALHALDRLGDGSPEHRRTVIDLLCSYLRMPFREPNPLPAGATAEQITDDQKRAQERVVRLTAQRLPTDRRFVTGSAEPTASAGVFGPRRPRHRRNVRSVPMPGPDPACRARRTTRPTVPADGGIRPGRRHPAGWPR